MAETEQPRGAIKENRADQDTHVAHCCPEKRTAGCGVAAFVSMHSYTHTDKGHGGGGWGGGVLSALALQSGSVGSRSRLYTQSQRAGPRRLSGVSQTLAPAALGNSWSKFHHDNTNSGVVPIPTFGISLASVLSYSSELQQFSGKKTPTPLLPGQHHQ